MLSREKVEAVLFKMGMPANVKGFGYIVDGVLLLEEDSKIKTTYLYFKVAQQHGTTGQRVERAIRHAFDMYIEQWFDRCYFSIMPEETFLSYLLEMREIDSVLECWEILQELKDLEEPDCYDKEELEIQQNTLEEYFQEYRTYTREPTEDQLEAAMEKVLEWNKEREYLLEGNVPEKSLGR